MQMTGLYSSEKLIQSTMDSVHALSATTHTYCLPKDLLGCDSIDSSASASTYTMAHTSEDALSKFREKFECVGEDVEPVIAHNGNCFGESAE